jgi:two-component system cell cycle sensor histidine kinase PleC
MFTEYFSNILHDIKTPLNIILGAIQLIEQNNTSNLEYKIIQDKHFNAIKQNTYRLLHLVNSIFDSTNPEHRNNNFSPEDCNVVSLIEELVQISSPYAMQKGITLEFDASNEEIIAAVDIDKFERIILNLLSNAIKFTPSGGRVLVYADKIADKIYISVEDSGIGIPLNMQETIFERFSQVNSPTSSKSEGFGIGLSIVKFFVDLHKGKVSLISKEGEGSNFIVEIPIKNEANISIY